MIDSVEARMTMACTLASLTKVLSSALALGFWELEKEGELPIKKHYSVCGGAGQ